ncbi:DUF1405 domain-containing protein [Caldibacillus lycopersici]|uniref:DUF1405 domain-containing protein n=2 Tax=Perspicuibacillus lycopersici TaxID=1325689 RepID=A0AAE3IT53_9BACI|nr:DUF1405 domain-containing protein [Perspicuibacillus lycopersici]MCU9613697.1 DUF1405 domain-containing protein [Perspicuibacillus lycopersici]
MLTRKSFLSLLLIINIVGTIYGYIWYGYQLAETPAKFLIFVPDSPTASLFFVFVIIAFLMKTNWPLVEALAVITLFKYGIWAVVMNILTLIVTGYLPWEGYMLIASHFAMALQGILYSPFYRLKLKHIVIAAIWTLHNDIIDYVFFMYPSYRDLNQFVPQIGYFTFWLSIFSIGLAYYLGIRKNRKILTLPF